MAIHSEHPQAIKYWKKHVEIPCNKVLTQGHKVSEFTDRDCQVAATPEQHLPTGGLQFNTSGIPCIPSHSGGTRSEKKTPPGGPAPADQPKTTKGQSKQDANGIWTVNVKGVAICAAYNQGKCEKLKCPHNKAHQCNKCLQNSHKASFCGQPVVKVKKGKGKKA